MSKRQWLMVFGVLIIVLPFLGFPSKWITTALVILGLLVIFVSYRIVPPAKKEDTGKVGEMPFMEERGNINSAKNIDIK